MSEGIWQAVVVVLALLSGLNAVLLVAVMRQVGTISLQIGPPRSGDLDEGPEVGDVLDIPELAAQRPTMLIFLAPGCPGCDTLLPAIPAAVRAYPELTFVAAITYGDDSVRSAYARKLGDVVRRDLDDLHARLDIPGTPFVLALDTEHRVVKGGVANNLAHLEAIAGVLLTANTDQHDDHPATDGTGISISDADTELMTIGASGEK